MRNYIYYMSFLLLASLCMVSCTEHNIEGMEKGQYIRIKTSCVNLNATRAAGDPTIMGGEEALNENLIMTVHYFLYPQGETDNAVLVGKIENINKNNKTDIKIPLVEEKLNKDVFPGGNRTCDVYLIANFPNPSSLESLSDTKLEKIKALVLTAFDNGTVGSDGKRSPATNDDSQESFVMDGFGQAELVDRGAMEVATGEIMLKRFAAKYTISVSTEESFEETIKNQDGSETKRMWTPVRDNMKVQIRNAVSNTTLEGTFGDRRFEYAPQKGDIKDVTKNNVTKSYNVFAPFYSYPCHWQMHENNAFAIYVELPWEYTENGIRYENSCYYKVIPNTTQLNRNSWYNIDLNIGVLGSFDAEETKKYFEITDATCSVVDWNNGNSDWAYGFQIDSDIKGANYLIVEQNEYVVNNQNEFSIPFISSHECIIKDLKVERTVFGTSNNDVPKPQSFDVTSNTEKTRYSIENINNNIKDDELKVEGSTIKLKHTLHNDFINSSIYDYTPYTITFTLCHKKTENQDKFKETITITQKPALSVTAHLNSYREAYLNEGLKRTDDQYGLYGYVYVNGNAPGNSVVGYSTYGGVGGINRPTSTQTNNTNPYMYVVEISVLPEGSNFVIGDPRVKYEFDKDIAAQKYFYPATSVNGGDNRPLTNYYGTIKDATAENMIAPKFRIASAHGRLTDGSLVDYTNVFNRAASYQEDGYPAGRWRVPTKAEIQFVYKLYLDDKIPPLFYGTYAYWCATGKFQYNNGVPSATDKNGSTPVRCIYDEWYWENTNYLRMNPLGGHPDKYQQFTWGDEAP